MFSPTSPELARRRAPEERPQQIIDAALAVFDERGLSGARLEDIAQRAGVAKGTIYLYFPDKEELFREVVRRTLVDRLEALGQEITAGAEAGASVDAQLRLYVERWWAFLVTPEFQAVYRLIIGELHRFPELADFYTREVKSRVHGLVGAMIARGIASGEFRSDIDARSAMRILGSLLVSHAMWTCRVQLLDDAPAGDQQTLPSTLLDFFLRGMRPDAPASGAAGGDSSTA